MQIRFSKVGLMFAAASVMLPGAAHSAPQTPATNAEALGKCLVKSDRQNAIALFSRLPADNSPADVSPGLGGCTTDMTEITAMQVRGAIAEALYERDFREAGVAPHQSADNFARLDLPEGETDKTGIFALGRCVALARFADVDRIFAMEPGSQRESNFVETLKPYFAACQPTGTQITIKRGDVRPILAQNAYAGNVRYWLRQAAVR